MLKNICFQFVRVEDLQNVRTQKSWSAKEFCRIPGHGVKHNSANFGQVFTAHGIYIWQLKIIQNFVSAELRKYTITVNYEYANLKAAIHRRFFSKICSTV